MVSNQICKSQNQKKLVEFVDKLNPAAPDAYAHLHAGWEEGVTKKQYSNIGINILDYSNGTGTNARFVTFNVSPEIFKQISKNISREIDRTHTRECFGVEYDRVAKCINMVAKLWDYMYFHFNLSIRMVDQLLHKKGIGAESALMPYDVEALAKNPFHARKEYPIYEGEKIYPLQEDNRAEMKQLRIRHVMYDEKGERRRAPWCITIESGTAIPQQTKTGGTVAQKGSYQKRENLYVWLSDDEMEMKFRTVCDYIRVFENTVCSQAIKEGRSLFERREATK